METKRQNGEVRLQTERSTPAPKGFDEDRWRAMNPSGDAIERELHAERYRRKLAEAKADAFAQEAIARAERENQRERERIAEDARGTLRRQQEENQLLREQAAERLAKQGKHNLAALARKNGTQLSAHGDVKLTPSEEHEAQARAIVELMNDALREGAPVQFFAGLTQDPVAWVRSRFSGMAGFRSVLAGVVDEARRHALRRAGM